MSDANTIRSLLPAPYRYGDLLARFRSRYGCDWDHYRGLGRNRWVEADDADTTVNLRAKGTEKP